MKVTDEMLTAYADAFDRASGRTTARRRVGLQAALDIALAQVVTETREEFARYKAVHAETAKALVDEIEYLQRLLAQEAGVEVGGSVYD